MSGVRFTREDVDLFAAAAHDRNPLHCDEDYARRTPFGRAVVHGMLATLSALAAWSGGRRFELASLHVAFRRPVFLDTDYELATAEDGAAVRVEITSGSAGHARLSFTPRPADGRGPGERASRGAVPRTVAAELSLDQMAGVDRVPGHAYAPDPTALAGLLEKLGVPADVLPARQVDALLWSSYVVGMECPGRHAVFTECELQFASEPSAAAFSSPGLAVAFDPRFALATLTGSATGVPGVRFRAIVRPVT